MSLLTKKKQKQLTELVDDYKELMNHKDTPAGMKLLLHETFGWLIAEAMGILVYNETINYPKNKRR